MPRITECLAARQEVAPEEESVSGKPCSFGCSAVCVGPKCPGQKALEFFFLNFIPLLELLSGLNGLKSSPSLDVDGNEGSLEPRISDPNEQGNADYVDDSEYDVVTDDYNYDTEEADSEGSTSDYSDTYDEGVEEVADDYDFDYATEDNIEVDVPLDLPLGKKHLNFSMHPFL